MNEPSGIRAWTFADQISSYRFWALIGAYLCVVFNSHLIRSGVLQVAREQMGFSDLSLVMGIGMPIGVVTGIIWGLLAVRSRTVRWLIGAALLMAVSLLWADAAGSKPTVFILLTQLLVGESLGYGFMLAMTALLVGGRGGSVALAGVLAVVLLLKTMVDMSGAVAWIYLSEQWPQVGAHLWGASIACVAVLLLAPLLMHTESSLFSGMPAARHRPLQPSYRHPLAAGVWGLLLWLGAVTAFGLLLYSQLWFFGVEERVHTGWLRVALVIAMAGLAGMGYWNYRIHGEIAALTPSPELLTPRAAAISCLLLPLGALLLPLQLATVLNQTQRVHISVAWLVCWSLLMPAIAMAQIQRAVNHLAHAENASTVLQGAH